MRLKSLVGSLVKNLLDKDPPSTAHDLDFAAGAGWDPRMADPRGRACTLHVSCRFCRRRHAPDHAASRRPRFLSPALQRPPPCSRPC